MTETKVLAAEWVLPVSAAPIRDGALVVEGERIAWVGERREIPSRFLRTGVRAFPRSLLLPGWVNAHTHLDLTAALGQISASADQHVGWRAAVDRLREALPPSVLRQAVLAGLDLLASTGTTTIAHVAPLPELEPFLERPLRCVVFHEARGFQSAQSAAHLSAAEDWLAGAQAVLEESGGARVRLGLAADSLATVSPHLLRSLVGLAAREQVPFSLHLAESAAEIEWLRSGKGPFDAWLTRQGDRDPGWSPPGLSPLRYLERLRGLEACGIPAVAAVNPYYLSSDEAPVLARAGCAVVYSPGSRRFFGHPLPPIGPVLAWGGRVALATESLAANGGMSLLREIRLAAEEFPEISRSAWVRSATLSGAETLGLGREIGSLEPGKQADVQVLGELAEATTDPVQALFTEPLRVRLLMVAGAPVRLR